MVGFQVRANGMVPIATIAREETTVGQTVSVLGLSGKGRTESSVTAAAIWVD
jgi:hypothetical protein